MAERWSFISWPFDVTRHVNMSMKPTFGTPVSSIGYALITCCGNVEMKAALGYCHGLDEMVA